MAESQFRGPIVSMGALEDSITASIFDGPSLMYQANGVPDPRFAPMAKDGTGPGRVRSHQLSPLFITTDNIPSTLTATAIATTAQSAVTSGFITLNATSLGGSAAGVPSYATGITLLPQGTTVATSVIALDFGFTTGTTVAASSTVVVVDSTQFQTGLWVCIGGVGNTSNSTSWFTQVTQITNATTIKVSPAPPGALSHAPIGNVNLQNTLLPPQANFGPGAPVPTSVFPYIEGGLGTFFNPVEGITRNITVTGNTTNATAVFLVSGFDVYAYPMTEQLTAIGTTTINGKKAFKYVLSIQCTATSVTGTYQFGVGDIFGCNIRADRYEALTVVWNAKNLSAAAGFTAAFSSVVSNNTSADVRGTLSVQNFTAFNAATSNGTGRLFIGVDLPLLNTLNAAAGSTAATSMYGQAQA